ncbi:GntR family transcriptional regulator [Plebeiibacterium sediminum]|uniref:GntR family transcriptional regulator n=1 Tax=Plebeiibacterium sediminum TaxID=2992112 RepID=A0AAE3SE97_9BACT|nr:GntR family transcriptional regulator [Plebeiobacterium sediminum]MCW3785986.1 GntR family transcriptional regulator [Plebeiobacterium sediminum]
MINRKNSVPLHEQVEYYLRSLIERKEYKDDGSILPAELELAQQLGVSRTTVRQAINKLVFEGLLTRKKKVGTRVAKSKITGYGQEWMSFTQEMHAMGIEVRNYEMHTTWEKANKELAVFFGVEEGSEILRLERLRGGVVEGPFVLFVSYFNPKIGLTGDENFSQPLYSILEKDYGITVKTSQEEISAVSAGAICVKKLKVSEGVPIFKRERKVYDADGNPVEYNVGLYKADSFKYSIVFNR